MVFLSSCEIHARSTRDTNFDRIIYTRSARGPRETAFKQYYLGVLIQIGQYGLSPRCTFNSTSNSVSYEIHARSTRDTNFDKII